MNELTFPQKKPSWHHSFLILGKPFSFFIMISVTVILEVVYIPKQTIMRMMKPGAVMGETTKVILWGRDDVICRGVEIFLRSYGDYDVRRIIGESCYEGLIQEIERENPDVVIINPGQQPDDSSLPLLLMRTCSSIKVITLDLEDCSVDVYYRQKVCMTQVSDLIDLVG